MTSFTENRTRIEASTLSGPRVYSTDLHPSLYKSQDRDFLLEVTARSLKIKLLTKGTVTINSAHLLSPMAVHLFDRHPDLAGSEGLLPAFRTDLSGLHDLTTRYEAGYKADGISPAKVDQHVRRLEERIKAFMPWELRDVGNRYQARLLQGLEDDSSVVSGALRKSGGFDEAARSALITAVQTMPLDDSAAAQRYLAERTPPSLLDVFGRYNTACYHLIGTEVVRCETGTDLSPLSNFKAADAVLTAAEFGPLSEEGVFLRLFFAEALDVINAGMIPTAIIDVLSFEEVHGLSAALREQGFQERYESVIEAFVTTLALPDKREALEGLDAEKIAGLAMELGELFRSYLDGEISEYRTKLNRDLGDDVVTTGADTLSALIGAVPACGNAVSLYEGAKSGLGLAKSLKNAWATRNHDTAIEKGRKERREKLIAIVSDLKHRNQAKLLEGVAALADVHTVKTSRL